MKCLAQDEAEGLKKQSHTARRIYHRLKKENGFTCGESTIRNIVNEMRLKQKEAFIPLESDPGEAAQIDWGEATVLEAKKQRYSYSVAVHATVQIFLSKPFIVRTKNRSWKAMSMPSHILMAYQKNHF